MARGWGGNMTYPNVNFTWYTYDFDDITGEIHHHAHFSDRELTAEEKNLYDNHIKKCKMGVIVTAIIIAASVFGMLFYITQRLFVIDSQNVYDYIYWGKIKISPREALTWNTVILIVISVVMVASCMGLGMSIVELQRKFEFDTTSSFRNERERMRRSYEVALSREQRWIKEHPMEYELRQLKKSIDAGLTDVLDSNHKNSALIAASILLSRRR